MPSAPFLLCIQFLLTKLAVIETMDNLEVSYWDNSVPLIDHYPISRNSCPKEWKQVSCSSEQTDDRQTLFIQALFELNAGGKYKDGCLELMAAQLAIEHVNQKGIIPGYTLQIYANDSKCDSGVGISAFFHALNCKPQSLMLLGSGCSHVTGHVAQIVSYWNLIQISYASTSPALSDRKTFPLFYRTVAPDSSHNIARTAFLRKYSWDTVAILSQDDDLSSLGTNDLVAELEKANISVGAAVSFIRQEYKEQIHQLKKKDGRIIIGSFSMEMAPKIFCEVYHLGMFGAEYVWILQEPLLRHWWKNTNGTNCTEAQLSKASDGFIALESHNAIVGTNTSVSGMTYSEFVELFESGEGGLPSSVPLTYDAIWVMALTLREAKRRWSTVNNSPQLHEFTYSRHDMTHVFNQIMGNVSFLGVSGPLSFRGSDRIGISAFYQNQGGKLQKIALFNPERNSLHFDCKDCLPIHWQGGRVPIAKRIFKTRIVTVNRNAFFIVLSLVIFGIGIAFTFLVFNLYFRKLRYIKLSSPKFNNITAVGCILVYLAIILLGVDHSTLSDDKHFPIICTGRALLLASGFSLAFGSMFTKTFRVHQIFIRARSGLVKSKILKDSHLLILVGVLLFIDVALMIVWSLADPMQRHLRHLTPEISETERNIVYLPQVEECFSKHIGKWLGALYVYKGMLLAVGVYMAWETRNVKIPALNDSHYIGMNVYNVVITSATVVVIANLIFEQKTIAYLVVSIIVFASTTTTLCLLFVPKLVFLWQFPTGDPVVESMGLKLECNTRRFVTDDTKELYQRAQIQNRAYKKELKQLLEETDRLETLLKNYSSSSSIPDHLNSQSEYLKETQKESSPKLNRAPQIRNKSSCDRQSVRKRILETALVLRTSFCAKSQDSVSICKQRRSVRTASLEIIDGIERNSVSPYANILSFMQEGILFNTVTTNRNSSFASCEWLFDSFPERKMPYILVSLRVNKFLVPGKWNLKSLQPTDLLEGRRTSVTTEANNRTLTSVLAEQEENLAGSKMTDSEKMSVGRPSLAENNSEDGEAMNPRAGPDSTDQHLRMERLRAELSKLEVKLKELQQESSVIFV